MAESPLRLVVVAALAGAQAAVRAGLAAAADDDPGRPEAEAVLAWLDTAPARRGAPAPTDPAPRPGVTFWPDFLTLVEEFRADSAVGRQLGPWAPPVREPAAAWTAFWLALLRLEPAVGARWRAQARPVAVAAAGSGTAWNEIPGPRPDGPVRVLIPQAPTLGVPGLRETPDAGPPPDVEGVRSDPDLAAPVYRVLALLAADGQLCHALEGLRVTGIHPLGAGGADGYRAELIRRFHAAAVTAPGTTDRVLTSHQLDEAVCSIVHRPPAHRDSWWGELAAASQRALRAQVRELAATGASVDVRPLALLAYGDLIQFTNPDRNIAYPVQTDQVGQVLACLRTWLEIDGQVVPGRVVYGSG